MGYDTTRDNLPPVTTTMVYWVGKYDGQWATRVITDHVPDFVADIVESGGYVHRFSFEG